MSPANHFIIIVECRSTSALEALLPECRGTGAGRFNQLCRLVDVLLGSETPQAQANGAARRAGVMPQCQQHMRRRIARGITGRGRRKRNRCAQRRGVELTFTEGQAQGVRDALGRAAIEACLLYTSPSPRDQRGSRMPSSA